jgi:DNA-binding NarL/FixJ family response regulator
MLPESTVQANVVIVEDEPLFRDLLRVALSQDPDLKVVGHFPDSDSALQAIPQLKPHVAILDINLGESINGIQLGLLLRRQLPELGIVLLSNHADPEFMVALSSQAITGWSYLLKRSIGDVTTLRRAIHGAARQLIVLDPQLVASMQTHVHGFLARLTPRQQQILDHIAQGYTNAGIASELQVTEKSIENQINQLYQILEIERGHSTSHPRVKAVLMYLNESQTDWRGVSPRLSGPRTLTP